MQDEPNRDLLIGKLKKNLPIKHGGYLVKEGRKFTIIACKNAAGNSNFMDYYLNLSLDYKELAKANSGGKRHPVRISYTTISKRLNRLADSGPWSNKTQLKSVEDTEFFEIKIVEVKLRIAYFYDAQNRKVIIITNVFTKDEKIKKQDLENMKRIKDQFLKFRQRTIH